MKQEKPSRPLFRVLRLLLAIAIAWAVYSLAVTLGGIGIFWVYVGLFGLSAVLYVILVRGNLQDPPKEPPIGIDPAAWESHRTRILGYRRRYAFLPLITVGTLVSILLDYINLMWFGGMFL